MGNIYAMRKKITTPISTILYVEGGKFVSHMYKEGLEEEGFLVDIAYDGIDALEKMRAKKPDIVLLELLIPKKNGFEVLEEIRLDNALRQIPVVVLTELDTESDRQKAKSLGVSAYLAKSTVSIEEVIDTINERLHFKSGES
jgi:CheY-like chemotaxis protein